MENISLIIKPVSSKCNMACSYCFYSDVSNNRKCKDYGSISINTYTNIIKKALNFAQTSISILYQGGEPLIRGLGFYKEAVAIQKKLNTTGIAIYNAIQTNGLLLNEEYAKFFKKNNFLIGLSIDGPASLHNTYRKNLNGNASLGQSINALKILQKHNVNFNCLTVVTDPSSKKALQVYDFLKNHNIQNQQYIPCLNDFSNKNIYLHAQNYGEFLIDLFNLWYSDLQKGLLININIFINYISLLQGKTPKSCGTIGVCSKQLAVEADGSAYACDFYIMDNFYLGNFNTDNIDTMESKRNQINFVQNSLMHPSECKGCKYFYICRGGCMREREGQNKSSLCQGYYMFFEKNLANLQTAASFLQID